MVPTSPASRDYENGFNVDLMLKDLNIALECGEHIGLDLEATKLCRDRYQKISNMGYGKKDFSIIYQYLIGNLK
jgi:3-hydroxyisobutyrate dehydrogenase